MVGSFKIGNDGFGNIKGIVFVNYNVNVVRVKGVATDICDSRDGRELKKRKEKSKSEEREEFADDH